ncbi:50S ribosomal protein L11 methyltransferase [Namhaeicola litoreus]|uniref:Ribosomal protein L11 methyltransferase n=1 Tax=Namhaeicola litoreus TaxID=1052145 RepID=A0ABW3Y081_9FLAO
MNYIGYYFNIEPLQPAAEILIAELGEVGFESFVENENGVDAFIQQEDWHENILDSIQILQSDEFKITYSTEEIEQVNWNEEWEKNFEPISVKDMVSVRAPFHKNPNLTYDIVIEPKMSFGTGHHETTHMMIEQLLSLDLKEKDVLDMGSGTGILAIFAEMKGAKHTDAIDIDEWCYENALENIERNQCSHIDVYKGDVGLLKDQRYDLIIANINRNILLNDLAAYHGCLKNGGILLLSGFYVEDVTALRAAAENLGMKYDGKLEKNNWVSLKFLN